MANYSKKFLDLVSLYKTFSIKYENLKAITLAQWILETGRGSTKLAEEYNNFGGLKWRPEMKEYASEIEYTACDGIDNYCKFEELKKFITGYWHFIERAPYKGFEKLINDPKGYITFIAKCGYCPTVGYADHVISLLPEAQLLLGQTITPTKKKVMIEIGHGPHPKGTEYGANAGDGKTTEWDMNFRRGKIIQQDLQKLGIECAVIDLCETLIDLGKHAKGYDCFVSLHLNAFNNKVQGTETYYHFDGDDKDKKLARYINDAVIKELGFPDRDIQAHGYSILVESNKLTAACLSEAFFIDAISDTKKLYDLSDRSAHAIAKGIVKFLGL